MKILFLYTEIAAYFLSCLNELIAKGAEVHLVKWEINKVAPFAFKYPEKIKLYNRAEYTVDTLIELVEKIQPDIIYCSGWMDSGYVQVSKKIKNQIPIILGFDNIWTGNLKQRLSALYASNTFIKNFSHCFIPGKPQVDFAKKLGFLKSQILSGVYCADVDFYRSHYEKNKMQKLKKFPKRFIYVGRYVKEKGVELLWDAFSELHEESSNDWELWCFGVGELSGYKHPNIKHFGFVQPNDMAQYILQTGIFVLPSIFEPWGVVVHEFAAAGFPLLCSDKVGAASQFLEDNVNGYLFKSNDKQALKNAMRKTMELSQEKLIAMGDKSVELSNTITPDLWASTLISTLKNK